MNPPAEQVAGCKHVAPLLAIILLGFFTFGGLTSLAPDTPRLMVLHGLFEIASTILGFIGFFITWYGTSTNNLRINAMSLVVLSASVLELVHALSYPGAFGPVSGGGGHIWITSWVFSRLIWSLGLLYAVTLPEETKIAKTPAISAKVLLYGTLIATAGLVANAIFGFNLWPALSIQSHSQPIVIVAQYLACAADLITLIIIYRRPPSHAGNLPLFALAFGTLADFSFSLAVHTPYSLNVAGHFFLIAANLYVLRTLYVHAIQRPFDEVIKLKEDMEGLAEKNANLYQESERQRNLLEDVLAKIGMIISSQLDRKETLEAIADMVANNISWVINCKTALPRRPLPT